MEVFRGLCSTGRACIGGMNAFRSSWILTALLVLPAWAVKEETSFVSATNYDEPFVVRGGCKHFKALGKWTKDYLLSHLRLDRSATVEFFEGETFKGNLDVRTMEEFYDTIDDLGDGEKIYLREFPVKEKMLQADTPPVLEHFMGETIYLGDGLSSFHWHSSCNNVVLNQIRGEKTLHFISPQHYYVPSESFSNEMIQEIHPLHEKKLMQCRSLACSIDGKNVGLQRVVLQAGDSLFIPPGVWHNATGAAASVSIAQSYKRESFSYVFQDFRFFISCYVGPIYRYFFPRNKTLFL
jgi:hypothetical protein